MIRLRMAIVILIVAGLLGLSVIDLIHHRPKTALIGLLFATVNSLIFFWPDVQ